MSIKTTLGALALALTIHVAASQAADWGLKVGKADLQSAGPLAFGPDGILLVGDTKAATVFSIDTGDAKGEAKELSVEGLNEKVADLLSASPPDVVINDLAVNPLSGNVYLSVSVGSGPDARPALVRVNASGKLENIGLDEIAFSKVTLPDAPEDKEVGEGRRRRNLRSESITDLAYSDGKVLVSGMANAAAPSTVREIPFPFITADAGTSIEVYHGAHGRLENDAAVRVFVPFTIDGEPSLLAGFTCTPLVKFPLASLEPGAKVRGTTVAELGNRNKPLDMIVYEKDGKSFLLLANSTRGVMKISTDNVQREEGITEPIPDGKTAGQKYETISELKGVVQLDRLNDTQAVLLVQTDTGAQNLTTIELP